MEQTVGIIRRSWTGWRELRKFASRQFLVGSTLCTVAASATTINLVSLIDFYFQMIIEIALIKEIQFIRNDKEKRTCTSIFLIKLCLRYLHSTVSYFPIQIDFKIDFEIYMVALRLFIL